AQAAQGRGQPRVPWRSRRQSSSSGRRPIVRMRRRSVVPPSPESARMDSALEKAGPPAQGGRMGAAVFFRLLGVARPCRWPIARCLLLSLAVIPLALLTPLPLKIVVDNVLGTKPLPAWLTAIAPGYFDGSEARLLFFAIGMLIVAMLVLHLQG